MKIHVTTVFITKVIIISLLITSNIIGRDPILKFFLSVIINALIINFVMQSVA